VVRHGAAPSAVVEAAVVMAMTAAADAPTALRQALADIPATTLYADLSTASAGLKQRLAATAATGGLQFVDVALMAPVPGTGLHTPALASGPGAESFVEVLVPLGMPVECCGVEPGIAATRKLLRSVVVKGLAALVIESMDGAHAAGLAAETWANLADLVTAADGPFLRRLVEGTGPHAARRHHEMEAASALLVELGIEPVMSRSTVESLRRAEGGHPLPRLPG
jgi:3-hydroxyisobutyrate dehydrogenase-like beta-hydroxyacid dehydrogenase